MIFAVAAGYMRGGVCGVGGVGGVGGGTGVGGAGVGVGPRRRFGIAKAQLLRP